MKCDEAKPVCSRCQTTGRTCDGYGVLGGGGNTYLERYGRFSPSTQSPPRVPLSKPLAKSFLPDEVRYLYLYKQHVAWTSSGWYGHRFWRATVLPALVSEGAILHAVVALSAAHPWNFHLDQSSDTRERFIVKQYSKAICALQPLSSRYADSQDVTVVLVTCMIFTLLEYSRGRYEIAETHLKNGIRVLGERVPSIDKGILRSFTALITQRSLFEANRPYQYDENIDFLLHVAPIKDILLPGCVFASPEDAKYALDIILCRIARAEQLVQTTRTTSPRLSNPQQYLSLKQEQAELTSLVSSWHNTYLRTIPRIKTSPTTPDSLAFGTSSAAPISRETLSYTLLLLYHTLSLVKLSALLSTSESVYRTQTPLFLRILSHASEIYIAYSLAARIPHNVNLHESVSESGFIAPLYYTALKCRVRRIRRYAWAYLRQIPHKEGVWDSFLAANVVRGVMRLEEEDQVEGSATESEYGSGGEEKIKLGEVPVLMPGEEDAGTPELGRLFRSIRVEMQRDGDNQSKVICERLRRDGSTELIEFMVHNK